MLRKVCPGHGQAAERISHRRPQGGEAASAPPPSDPHVCIMSIDGGTVNPGSRAGSPGAARCRAASRFPAARRRNLEKARYARAFARIQIRFANVAAACGAARLVLPGTGKAWIVYTVIASRRLLLGVILPQRRHPGTRRRAKREAADPGPSPVAGKRDGVGDARTPPSFSVVPPFDIGGGMDPGSAPPLRSGSARDDEGEGAGARVKRGRRKGTGGRNVLPGAPPPPCTSTLSSTLPAPARSCVLRGSLRSRLRIRTVE